MANKFKPSIEPTKQYILNNVPQEHIMSYYLGVNVQYAHKFRSPLRGDKHPTCNFSWHNGKLYYRDWAEGLPKDCFNIVCEIFGDNLDQAVQRIATDFDIIQPNGYSLKKIKQYQQKVQKEQQYSSSAKSHIGVKIQKFTQTDINYLRSYYLGSEIVSKFNVFSPKIVWLNGQIIYTYTDKDPALAYYFGKNGQDHQKWKIYFYRRDSSRFLSNTSRINGWIQLPENGENLVITKSLKDVMCLNLFEIPAIAMQGEAQIPYRYIIQELENRFFNIYSLLDWDRTGIHSSWKLRKRYGIKALFLTDGSYGTKDFGSKDFSDYLKNNGMRKTNRLIGYVRDSR